MRELIGFDLVVEDLADARRRLTSFGFVPYAAFVYLVFMASIVIKAALAPFVIVWKLLDYAAYILHVAVAPLLSRIKSFIKKLIYK